jgi:hypothetical protein
MSFILISPSDDQFGILEQKMEAIANVSFLSKPGDTREISQNTEYIGRIYHNIDSDDGQI